MSAARTMRWHMICFGIIGAPLDNTFTTSGIMSPAFSQQHYLQCEYHAHVLNLHYAMMHVKLWFRPL